jgi:hypothetical protein
MNSNYEKYPNIFVKPQEIDIMYSDKCTLYQLNFNGLKDIHDFLVSNPEVNTEVFRELVRNKESNYFFGSSYEDALDSLVKETKVKEEIIDSINELASKVDERLINELDSENKTVDINVSLNYPANGSERSMLNRAIILASVIKALEDKGYKVKLTGVSLSKSLSYTEMLDINVKLKDYDEKLDLVTLFKATDTKSFLRRILFSVTETTDVKGYSWGDTYGINGSTSDLYSVIPQNNPSLYFDNAEKLKIYGDILENDFDECIETLYERIELDKMTEMFSKNCVYKEIDDSLLRGKR